MDAHLNNPAGRLWRFLDYSFQSGSQDGPILPVWATYLEIPANHSSAMYSALAKIRALPDETAAAIRELVNPPIPIDRLLENLPRAEEALEFGCAQLGSRLLELRGRYDAGILSGLETTSFILNSANILTPDPSDDALEQIRSSAEDILDLLLRDDTIDAELRRLLYEHASAISRSLDLFKIFGLEGVLGEYDRLIGNLARKPDLVDKISKHGDVLARLRKLITALGLIASLVNSGVSIESGVHKALQIDPSHVSVQAPKAPEATNNNSV
jgi:hypothetical protein